MAIGRAERDFFYRLVGQQSLFLVFNHPQRIRTDPQNRFFRNNFVFSPVWPFICARSCDQIAFYIQTARILIATVRAGVCVSPTFRIIPFSKRQPRDNSTLRRVIRINRARTVLFLVFLQIPKFFDRVLADRHTPRVFHLDIQSGFAKMSDLGAKMPNLGQKRLFEVILGSFEVT